MKIISLQAENIKRLTAVQIDPTGAVIKISGKNGSGKTSILDAIWWAMGGANNIPDKPIRDGELSARIKIDIGELVVERKFTKKGSTLRVTAADGTPITKPQNVLDALLGKLTFDPLVFMRMKAREQFEELVSIVDVDQEELNRLDTNRENASNYKNERVRQARALRARIDAFNIPANAPTELINPLEISEKIEQSAQIERSIFDANQVIEDAKRDSENFVIRINVVKELIHNAVKHIEEVQEQIDRHNGEINAANLSIEQNKEAIKEKESFLEKTVVPDTTELREQLSTVNEKNAVVHNINEREQLRQELSDAERETEKLKDDVEKIDEEKKRLISSAKFPVEGLSFDGGEVIYNGLPLEQASGAEQLRVSMGMAMAINPDFKVIRITDGSLMDSESFKMIEEMAEDKDFQVWVEVVDETGGVGVVIEDGHVAKVN